MGFIHLFIDVMPIRVTFDRTSCAVLSRNRQDAPSVIPIIIISDSYSIPIVDSLKVTIIFTSKFELNLRTRLRISLFRASCLFLNLLRFLF